MKNVMIATLMVVGSVFGTTLAQAAQADVNFCAVRNATAVTPHNSSVTYCVDNKTGKSVPVSQVK